MRKALKKIINYNSNEIYHNINKTVWLFGDTENILSIISTREHTRSPCSSLLSCALTRVSVLLI